MPKAHTGRNGSVLTIYDLCLDCSKNCKCEGPPWCKLECSSFSNGTKRKIRRVINMTDEELIARVAYA